MQVWSTILNIVIFILCLSVVVCIHEAGHLAVAKICHVYCFEYSIGFGPVLFHHKFKHKRKALSGVKKSHHDRHAELTAGTDKVEGETTFAIRALPLGGYVAMAGDDGEAEAGVVVPPDRTLNGVNHGKQIAIMLAGITMNFLLAYLLFLCDYAFCPQTEAVPLSNAITVSESDQGAFSYQAGLRTGDQILTLYQEYHLKDKANQDVVTEFPLAADRVPITAYLKFTTGESDGTFDQLSKDCISYASVDAIAQNLSATSDSEKVTAGNLDQYHADSDSIRIFHLTYLSHEDGSEKSADITVTSLLQSDKINYAFNKLGISVYTKQFYFDKGEAWGQAGNTFGRLFVGLYHALGSIFTPSGWKNVGGIVSVYKLSAQGVTSGSVGYFLLLWGYISLDLGCFNLLPFPGLDGWQTLMALIETITRKKLPSKFKNVANTIGIIVLMILAGLLIVKDIVVK
jgi:regulator of sigma E protease